MSCAAAVASPTPVFSPSSKRSSSLFCKSASSEALNPNGCSSPSPSFKFRFQKQQSGLRVYNKEEPISVCSSYSKQSSGFRVFKKDESIDVSSSSSSSLTVLKRKRPGRIDIPIASSISFGSTETKVDVREVEFERLGFYSVYCKRGRRDVMEDRYIALMDVHGDPKQALFGVFDGHGGTRAAEFAAENIGKNIMCEVMKRGEDRIEEAVKEGYLTTDLDFLKEESHSGTCCVTTMIRNGNLIVSNAGDCRAVVSRGGVAEALTEDHRLSGEDERDRIQRLGGYVDCRHGVWRLQGSLAVSRGIGDLHLKQWVIAEPDTRTLRIKPECEFLVLASDGLWDKVGNQEAVDMARPLCVDNNEPSMLSACKKLAELSVIRGSSDDITVMIIQLKNYKL